MSRPPVARTAGRSKVLAWALWDCGSTGMNAIVATFVFSVYLTSTVGHGMPGDTSPASWLGRALTIAGLTVAVFAPVTGVLVQAPQRRRAALTILSALAVLSTAAMSLIRADPAYFALGLVLLAFTAACGDLASVPYNAMLRQLTTQENSGRISGLGWAAGYLGSVALLLLIYVGFIAGSGPSRGLLSIPVDDGQNVRAAMLLAAGWFVVFAMPLLVIAHTFIPATEPDTRAVGLLGGYRRLWQDLRAEWRRDRNLVYYLVVSAIFRDGLAGVFAFGAVLGVSVYGISQADVLIFGVVASTMAAFGAVAGGHLDDRLGAKPVIVASLSALIAVGITLMSLSGPVAFWVCGLLLALFVGPTQSAARTLLLRMASDGKEAVAFGLYTMTGRAVAFIAPWLFFVFVDAFHSDRAGLAGLCVVLAAGLVGMLLVKVPGQQRGTRV
ncbi:MFS transporter [Mycolicibacterium sp. CH28]|uniref:MFS transporter n=1 Tax=Mycolicibacterium sp. CH28 TaxID=2512237 RepID=UPI001082130D|nr:MFS transporter [Mycolicibacterium sp. CH28]TGD85171.1 MFS transporter [Mycolicibacterium sp. CH28]